MNDFGARPEKLLADRFPFFYGWVILWIAIVATFACYPGQTLGVSSFNESFRRDLQLSHTQLSGAYMVATFLAGMTVMIIGSAMDRYGLRQTMTVVVVALGSTCLFTAQVTGLWSLFLAFLLLRMFGHGGLPLLAVNTLAMWFRRRLGLVTGLSNLANAVAIALVPTLNLKLIDRFGWRWAYAILGVGLWLLMLPLLAFVFRNRPEDIEQSLDGIAPGEAGFSGSQNDEIIFHSDSSFDLRAAAGTRAYWILIFLNGAEGMVWAGVIFNIGPLFESHALGRPQITAAMVLYAVCLALAQLGSGFLADHLPLNLLLSLGSAGIAAAMLILTNLQDQSLVQLFAVTFGFSMGLATVAGSTVWARYFGRDHLGKIRGSATMSTVVGSSIGPFLVGTLFDLQGHYDAPLWVFSGVFSFLAVALLFATPPAARCSSSEI